jgi:hypothetical protein
VESIDREGVVFTTGPNDGAHTDALYRKGGGPDVYQIEV